MTELPVLCPALVFLEYLDKARSLGHLESGERPDLLSGSAVVLVRLVPSRVPMLPAYLATSASIFAYLSTVRAGRRPLAGSRRARSWSRVLLMCSSLRSISPLLLRTKRLMRSCCCDRTLKKVSPNARSVLSPWPGMDTALLVPGVVWCLMRSLR
ncbi:hypothetical protein IG631_19446 [Alternaria alternata]|nr:hypothetical protein IG631_19446 [Alternaria alternata]